MITIKDYIEELFFDIPKSTEKEDVKQEIILNLEEKVQELMEEGKSQEDAINKSIVDFGDIGEIKKDLMGVAKPIKYKSKSINYSNNLWFSIIGSALIIGLFLFINFYYSPNTIWFVYPTFAILWWPLSMFFSYINNKSNKRQ